MLPGAGRYRLVLEELTEWAEDVAGGLASQVVFLGVPRGWGRSAVLGAFGSALAAADGLGMLVAVVEGGSLPGRAVQAGALAGSLEEVTGRWRAAGLLDLDTAAGRVQLGLAAAGLLASGFGAAVSLLVASLAVTAAGNAWDASAVGEQGAVARAARAVAAMSVRVPVVVVIDDADDLDPGLAVALIRNLAGRIDGRVLVVAAAAPGSDLLRSLASDPGPDLLSRVHRAGADPGMGFAARAALAAELLPQLPAAGAELVAGQTATFAEVLAVTAAGSVADLGPDAGVARMTAVIGGVAAGLPDRAAASAEAAVATWAGGTLHETQASRALEILGQARHASDPDVRRTGQLVAQARPGNHRTAAVVARWADSTRRDLAAAVLAEAIRLAADPGTGMIERVIARHAAHLVRGDLADLDRAGLAGVQVALIRGLETLGDPGAAWQVAGEALDGLPAGAPDRPGLLLARLRLAGTRPDQAEESPLTREAVGLALAGGAAIPLEARLWAAVNLLHRPGHRDTGLRLAARVAGDLNAPSVTGDLAARWRLLLAFHVGQAGDTALAQQLLAPLLSRGPAGQQDAAAAVLRAIGGPRADTRLQIILLEAELTRTPASSEQELLRLHLALAADYDTLADSRNALRHGHHALTLQHALHHPDHPRTLTTRSHIASWTGECGDAAAALQLARDLLPDRERVLGPAHPDTLTTRNNIAVWTGGRGDGAAALQLLRDLLPDQERVLGPVHPGSLTTRNNIAFWTSRCGDAAGALQLFWDLLSDQERVLGPAHPDTLRTCSNIAALTGQDKDGFVDAG